MDESVKRRMDGSPSPQIPCFDALPSDLICRILNSVSMVDLCRAAFVCRKLKKLVLVSPSDLGAEFARHYFGMLNEQFRHAVTFNHSNGPKVHDQHLRDLAVFCIISLDLTFCSSISSTLLESLAGLRSLSKLRPPKEIGVDALQGFARSRFLLSAACQCYSQVESPKYSPCKLLVKRCTEVVTTTKRSRVSLPVSGNHAAIKSLLRIVYKAGRRALSIDSVGLCCGRTQSQGLGDDDFHLREKTHPRSVATQKCLGWNGAGCNRFFCSECSLSSCMVCASEILCWECYRSLQAAARGEAEENSGLDLSVPAPSAASKRPALQCSTCFDGPLCPGCCVKCTVCERVQCTICREDDDETFSNCEVCGYSPPPGPDTYAVVFSCSVSLTYPLSERRFARSIWKYAKHAGAPVVIVIEARHASLSR